VDENKDVTDMSVLDANEKENCKLAEIYKRNIKNNSAEINKVINYCEQKRYPLSVKPMTLEELLTIIKKEKSSDVITIIEKFPMAGSSLKIPNTANHVFEALWVLIFLFNYDDLRGENQERKFFNTLEKMNMNERSIQEILKKQT
jgi:hypothetical protein